MIKAVLISGAGSGIGEATALEFSQQGYAVFLLGRSLDKLQAVAKKLPLAKPITCDVSDASSTLNAFKIIQAHSEWSIEVLVNNAGIYNPKPFLETTDEDWLREINTNLMGAVRITREVFKYFKTIGHGSVVNVSSTLGLSPVAGTSAYSASKAAMINWTQTLALEGAPFLIRANCICPGLVETPIHGFDRMSDMEKEAARKKLAKLQPLGRIGAPSEIAKAVFFLGSENSSWTTGSVLSVDGGINLL